MDYDIVLIRYSVLRSTSHNKRLTFRRLSAAPGFRSARSLRSHASLHPHFTSPGLCFAKPLFGLVKRRQPRTLCEMWTKLNKELLNLLTLINNIDIM